MSVIYHLLRISTLGCCALLGACQSSPPAVTDAVQPKAQPVHNITTFSSALTCMDDLFASHGVRNIVITSQGIPDATGEIRAGTKDMLISAISRMSTHSSAFRFVDYDQRQRDINALQGLVGFTDDFLVPRYYIRGAITQFDEQVLSASKSGGVSLAVLDVGGSGNKVTSLVTMDLNVGNLLSRQIITGTGASNSIAVSRSGRSADLNGNIDKWDLGFSFNVNMNQSEGVHQSVRTLLQLSVIESLGKLAEVPYWQCLGAGEETAATRAQAKAWYRRMSGEERLRFVQQALTALGVYSGDTDGKSSPELRRAIGQWQRQRGLLANGKIDFALYDALLAADIQVEKNTLAAPQVASAVKTAPSISLQRSNTPAHTRSGDTLSLRVATNADAFVYCYYRDGAGSIARLFPNRFQPDALLLQGKTLTLPGGQSPYSLVFEQSGVTESVLCVAASEELGIRLPPSLKAADLSPLAVASLDVIRNAFIALDAGGVSFAQLDIEVSP